MMRSLRPFSRSLTLLLAFSAAVAVQAQDTAKAKPATTFKPEELEQLVAPIALYPDAVLAQVLMASTYPLEVVEAARWSKEHPDVKGDALDKEMEKQSWDPSVKSLTSFPDVLTMMNEKLDWTQKLGDAFLAEQKPVMDAVQRLRAKAKAEGNLKSTKEQTVKTEPAAAGSSTTTIIIEPADPEVVYVPTYNATVVYGAWPYPAYPPYYYYPPAYAAGGMFFAFTVGVAVGGGGCCWGGCNWGTGDVDIDVNRNVNIDRDNINVGNDGKWKHNAEHRKGVQYRDSATQQKYGKASDRQATQAREQYRGHAEQGREQIAREGAGNQRDLSGKPVGGQTRDSAGNLGGQTREGASNYGGQTRDMGSQSRDYGSSSNRSKSSSSSSRSSSAFSGVGSGGSTRASSSRGMSSRGGGGGGRRR